MSEILCSIVVPVYNRRELLPRCVDSLLQLQLSSYEVILVDDGSEDGAGELCEQYARRESRVRVIRQTNQGVVVARAAGWQASCGKYVAFVDSDDWLEADTYTGLLQAMEADSTIDIGVTRLVLEYADGHAEDMFPEHQRRLLDRLGCMREIFLEQRSFCWEVGKVCRRSLLMHWQPDASAYPCEDLDMFWQMLCVARRTLYDGTAIYHYLIHERNSQGTDILLRDSTRSLLHVWRDVMQGTDRELQQNLCVRLLLATCGRIRERYLRGNPDPHALQDEIHIVQEVYQQMPNKDKAPAFAALAAAGGAAAVQSRYQQFWDAMSKAVAQAGAFANRYIYGTGTVSKWLSQVCEQAGLKVSAYLVSDNQPRKSEFMGHEVRYLSDIPAGRENNAFIVAMADPAQSKVAAMLRQRGEKNVLTFSTDFFFEKRKYLSTKY